MAPAAAGGGKLLLPARWDRDRESPETVSRAAPARCEEIAEDDFGTGLARGLPAACEPRDGFRVRWTRSFTRCFPPPPPVFFARLLQPVWLSSWIFPSSLKSQNHRMEKRKGGKKRSAYTPVPCWLSAHAFCRSLSACAYLFESFFFFFFPNAAAPLISPFAGSFPSP